ncbi:MAG: tRNA (N6-threonylcarbamoyladenosine(37)-N6)-methyltransferase TrmO [Nitrososphaerota archaeon]
MEEIKLKPIGIVRSGATPEQVKEGKYAGESIIEIYPEFEQGLEGLQGFSHIFVLAYFNMLRPEQIGPLKVKPRGLLRYGLTLEELPTIGVFALDSPTRPNPIALSLVHLIKITQNRLRVANLDLFDGTPVLDIKPYQASYHLDSYNIPAWHKRLIERAGRV